MPGTRGRPKSGVAAVDEPLRLEFRTFGLPLLLGFVNHPRPVKAWTDWNRHCHAWTIRGAWFDDALADQLREDLRGDLQSLLAPEPATDAHWWSSYSGYFSPTVLTVQVQWQAVRDDDGRVVSVQQLLHESDLHAYFQWVLWECLRERYRERLRACEVCGDVFELTRRTRTLCQSVQCRQARNRAHQRTSRLRDRLLTRSRRVSR